MIVDQLTRANQYAPLRSALRQGFAYLESGRFRDLADGRHSIDDGAFFAILQTYETKPVEACVWESHRRFIDIQYVIEGVEWMGYAPLETMRVREAYDPEKDVALHDGSGDFVAVRAGMFAVFLPHDVHKPGATLSAPGAVRKVVLKIPVESKPSPVIRND